MKKLTIAQIKRIHEAVLSAGLAVSRTLLLTGINKAIASSAPIMTSALAQIYSDITWLNDADLAEDALRADGGPPLVRWLQNAIVLTRDRQEEVVFASVLHEYQPRPYETQTADPSAKGQTSTRFDDARRDASEQEVAEWRRRLHELASAEVRQTRIFNDHVRSAIRALRDWEIDVRKCSVFGPHMRFWGLCQLRLDREKRTAVWLAWDSQYAHDATQVPLVVIKELRRDRTSTGSDTLRAETEAYRALAGVHGVPRLRASGDGWLAIEFAQHGTMRGCLGIGDRSAQDKALEDRSAEDQSTTRVPNAAKRAYKPNARLNSDALKDWAVLCDCFVRLFQTLAAIHERDWVHADLHLSNIVITRIDDEGLFASLVDFQYASNGERLRQSRGTFAAPEGTGTKAADVFSLAQILRHCLFHSQIDLSRLAFIEDGRHHELKELLDRATSGKASLRGSASAIADKLAQVEWRAEKRGSIGLVVALALMGGLLALVGAWYLGRRSSPEAPWMQTKCAELSKPIFVGGSTGIKPFLEEVARALAGEMRIVYLPLGSCVGVEAMTNSKPINAATATYWTDQGEQRSCALDEGGVALDVAISDVFPSTCLGESSLLTKLSDSIGPVQAIAFVVPHSSKHHTITLAQARATYQGGAGSPWPSKDNVLCRASSSGTQLIVSRTIGVSASEFVGVENKTSEDLVSALLERGRRTPEVASETIGMASVDIATKHGSSLRVLAFQDAMQSDHYLPDSSPDHRDKLNVRKGNYRMWGALHVLTRRDVGQARNAPNARSLLAEYLATVKDLRGLNMMRVYVSLGLVPQCAMEVTRNSDGGELRPHAPEGPCGCLFEVRAGTLERCAKCQSQSDCRSSAICSFGYCEEKQGTANERPAGTGGKR